MYMHVDSGRYVRFNYREATDAGILLGQLTAKLPTLAGTDAHLVHLDIGHVVPSTANTVLFELLVVGVISDQRTGRIYRRDLRDQFFVEVPNSATVLHTLRVCGFLPGCVCIMCASCVHHVCIMCASCVHQMCMT